MSNYRPVSNLSYISKVMERVVAIRLNEYLVANNLLPRFQSAYRRRHSTETAMLRVWSDILRAADQRHVTLLGLLDMSAAFDCVDHDLLLQDYTLGSACLELFSNGFVAFSRVVLNKFSTTVKRPRFNSCHSAFHKVLCWGHCCTFCTQQN